MLLVPQSLYESNSEEINVIMADGLACILSKTVLVNKMQCEKYLSAHAIMIVLNGQMRIESHSGLETIIGAKQMVFLPKGLYMISDIIPNETPFKALIFFFDKALIEEYIKMVVWEDYEPACLPFLVMNQSQSIDMYLDTIIRLYENTEGNHHPITRSKLLELLHLINLTGHGKEFSHAVYCMRYKRKQSIKDLMEANYSKPLAVADYAYLSGRSISSFHRDFKRLYGLSPKKWLIDRRIEKAVQLIELGNPNILEISLDVGYKNVSHFIKAFRQKMSISPKQYHLEKRRTGIIEPL